MILYHKRQRAEAVMLLAALGVPRSAQLCVDDVFQIQGVAEGTCFMLIEDVNMLKVPTAIWREAEARCTMMRIKHRRQQNG